MKTISKSIIPIVVIGILALSPIVGIDLPQWMHDNLNGTAEVSTWNRALSLYEAMLFQPSSIGSMDIHPGELRLLLREFQDHTEADIWARQFCVSLLGEIGSEGTKETLIDALQDDSAGIRNVAAISLGKYGDYEDIEPLIAHLVRASKENTINAPTTLDTPETLQTKDSIENILNALLSISDPKAKHIFMEGLKNETDVVRVASALWLGQSEDSETASLLVETLRNEEGPGFDDTKFWKVGHIESLFNIGYSEMSPVEAEAIALARINEQDSIRQLIEIAVSDGNLASRQGAIVAIALTRDPSSVKPLTELLNDQREIPMIRKTAAFTLGNFHIEEARDGLISGLQDSDLAVKLAAALSLANLGYTPADFVPTLLSSLQKAGASDEIRATAALVLGQMKEKSAVEPLIDILENLESDSVSYDLQEAIIRSLGTIGDDRVIDTLSDMVSKGETDQIKGVAIVSLGNLGSDRAFSSLGSFLEYPDSALEQYSLVISSLKSIDLLHTEEILMGLLFKDNDSSLKQPTVSGIAESVEPILIDLLTDKNDIPLKQAIILGLAESEVPEVIEFMLNSLKDNYPEIRYAALGALADKATLPQVKDAFIDLLKYDNNPLIRSNAALALEGIEDIEVTGALKAALNDPYPQVRKATILSLTPLADIDTMQAIRPLLSDPDFGVQQSAILSLGLRANDFPQNVDYLTPGLSHDNWRVRQTTIVGLGANIDQFPELKQPFLDIVNNPSQPMAFRQNAMLSLSKIDTPDIKHLLTDNLNNIDWRMRQTATLGLSGFNDPDIMTSLKPLTQDSYWQVRQAAAFSLRSFDETQATSLISPLLEDPYWQVRHTAVNSINDFNKLPNMNLLTDLKNDNNYFVRQATTGLLGTSISNVNQPQMLWVNSSQSAVDLTISRIKRQSESKLYAQYTERLLARDKDFVTQMGCFAIAPSVGGALAITMGLLGDAASGTAQIACYTVSNTIGVLNIINSSSRLDKMAGGVSLASSMWGQLTHIDMNETLMDRDGLSFSQYDGFTSITEKFSWQSTYTPAAKNSLPLTGISDVFGAGTRTWNINARWTEQQGLGSSPISPGYQFNPWDSSVTNPGYQFDPFKNYPALRPGQFYDLDRFSPFDSSHPYNQYRYNQP